MNLKVMMQKTIVGLSSAILILAAVDSMSSVAFSAELTEQQKKELQVFGGRAMGLKIGITDIKKVSAMADIETLVATGLNLNGHLCAEIKQINPLKVVSTYEVRCIAYRGGSGQKTYVVDALKGVAFVQ